MASTFSIVMFTFIVFRADTINDAFMYLIKMFSHLFTKNNYVITLNYFYWKIGLLLPFYILLLFTTEWIGRFQNFGLACIDGVKYTALRWVLYAFLIFSIAFFTRTNQTPFIYIQF